MLEALLSDTKSGVEHFRQIGTLFLTGVLTPDFLKTVDPSAALEPLVFLCFSARTAPRDLPQIILGYCSYDTNCEPVRLISNSRGVICLPNLGQIATTSPNSQFTGRIDSDGVALSADNGRFVHHRVEPYHSHHGIRPHESPHFF